MILKIIWKLIFEMKAHWQFIVSYVTVSYALNSMLIYTCNISIKHLYVMMHAHKPKKIYVSKEYTQNSSQMSYVCHRIY